MAKVRILNAAKVRNLTVPGLYADGLNLYLQVTAAVDGSVAKSWIFRYRRPGRKTPTDMGLGPAHTITLAEAREKATRLRKLRLEGVDPLDRKRADRAAQALAAAKNITFDEAVSRYITAHQAGWKNGKHAKQWRATLATYASPVFGAMPVKDIDLALVLKVLEPFWETKTETAARVRGRIERILDWAAVRGHRAGDNPARWRGHLDQLLPRRSKVAPVKHFAALPYADLPAFMAGLRTHGGVAARALELQILTACRPGEARGATWSEIEFDAKLWIIPAERMKATREHRIPLSDAALQVLNEMQKHNTEGLVFPGLKGGFLSDVAVAAVIHRMGHKGVTPHGFRSAFRDWAAERTAYPHQLAEMALAHSISDKTEAAYRRGDMLRKREKMMRDWAAFCDLPAAGGTVTSIAR